jgi:hypothetical protein
MTTQAIDDVLAGTFPASDPPAWTPGIARLAPAGPASDGDSTPAHDHQADFRPDVIEVPVSAE